MMEVWRKAATMRSSPVIRIWGHPLAIHAARERSLLVASIFFESCFTPLAGGFDMFGVLVQELRDNLDERTYERISQEFLGVLYFVAVSFTFKIGPVLRVFLVESMLVKPMVYHVLVSIIPFFFTP